MVTKTDEPSPGSWRAWHDEGEPVRLGVSSCLLGEEVRFDGGHARDRFVDESLGRWVEWVRVCPEVGIGMGIPRPTVRLVEDEEGGAPRMVAPSTEEDFTERMRSWSEQRVAEIQDEAIDGYVLKKNSPSCGMERLSIYRANGHRKSKTGVGLYAEALMAGMPQLPVEEEGRLNDPPLRENFIERVFSRHRWRTLVRRGLDRRRLVEFHTAHKLLLRAHGEQGYRELGRLVGSAGKMPDAELFARYEVLFQDSLRHKATVKRHTNVLMHALGYFKELLTAVEKRELLSTLEDYRLGLTPLLVPLSLLRYNVRKHGVEYLLGQLYFDPHPKEMMLRLHV